MNWSGLRKFVLIFIFQAILSFTQTAISSNEAINICRDYISQDADNIKNTQSSTIPFGSGLLWKITSPDGSESHIFGTMHSQDRLVTSLPPPVRLALVKSHSLVMEVIPDQQANDEFSHAIYFQEGTKLENMVDKDIFNLLSKIAPDYGIPVEAVERLKPWAAFTLIGRPKPVRALNQEMVLLQIAKEINIPVESLETMSELVETLESMPMQDQITILNDTVCNHRKIINDTQELVSLYVARDLAGMVNFNKQPHHDEEVFNRFMQKILYGRNEKIIERIEHYLAKGNSFIAIGAMHLPDYKGLLNLLQKRGYIISQIF